MAAALIGKQSGFALVRGTAQRRCKAPRQVSVAGSRPYGTWLPDVVPPPHLTGDLPGDFAFDPLGLGLDPERLKWFVEAEKTNGRWAMAGVAGILGQELLTSTPWWVQNGEYWLPPTAQLGIFWPFFGFLETKRYQGFKETGKSGLIDSFPFDPLGQNSPENAVKELKNGRLAMIAFVGFIVQAIATHTQPIEGLTKHLSDPLNRNITYYLTHLPEVIAGTA